MRFPNQLQDRLPSSIKQALGLAKGAHQRLDVVGSQVNALVPGDWELLTLANGWTNIAGFIPAQVQIQRTGMGYIVGHIQGGTVADGTVVGTLTAGFFNAVHAHSFTANVLAGAAAVANPVSTGSFNNGSLTGSITVPSGNQTLTGTVSGSTCSIKFGPSGYQFSPALNNAGGGYAGQSLNPQTTNINYNSSHLTVNTAGQVVLTNCPATATQLSFSENLPLVTS